MSPFSKASELPLYLSSGLDIISQVSGKNNAEKLFNSRWIFSRCVFWCGGSSQKLGQNALVNNILLSV